MSRELSGNPAIWESEWMSAWWQGLLEGKSSGLEGIGIWEDQFVNDSLLSSTALGDIGAEDEESNLNSTDNSSLFEFGNRASPHSDWLIGQLQQPNWGQILSSRGALVSENVQLTVAAGEVVVEDSDAALSTQSTQSAAAVSTDELVMHLAFDETSGTAASDSSPFGNDNDGTLVNGASFVDSGTALQGAVRFDGNNDYVAVATSNDINNSTVSQRTIAAWFKVDDKAGQRQVIFESGGTGRGFNMYIDGGQLYVGGWRTDQNWNGTFLSTDLISSDTWHHVTLVLDADGSNDLQSGAFRGYLDGTQFGSGTGMKIPPHTKLTGIGGTNKETRFHTGAIYGSGRDGLGGSVADVKLYNRVLSTDEIASLASALTTTDPLALSAALANDTGASSSDGLTNDSTITGSVGDVANLATLQARLDRDGVYVDITDLVQPDGSFSLSLDNLNNRPGNVFNDGAYTVDLVATDTRGNTSAPVAVTFSLDRTDPELTLTSPLISGDNDDQVRLVGNATEGGTLSISVDGGTASDVTVGADGAFDLPVQAQPLTPGAHQLTLNFTDIAGNVSQSTINFTVADSGNGGGVDVSTDELVMHLAFDETSGTAASDSSPFGNDNDGTLVNGASFVDSGTALQGAVRFDGNNDYVAVATSNDINNSTVSQRTIAAWFKVDDKAGQRQVIFESGGTGRGFNMYIDGGQLYVGGWRTDQNWNGTFLSTDLISSDTWHHVTLVLDADGSNDLQSGAFRGYLDGTQFGSGTGMKIPPHTKLTGIGGTNKETRFHTGAIYGSGRDGLGGSVADVKLYNRVLSTDEIASLASALTTTDPLALSAALANDTGASSSDGITTDATIAGSVGNASALSTLQARLGDSGDYVEITSAVQADGSFSLGLDDLIALQGGALIDGSYRLTLLATDTGGTVSGPTTIDFTLDRSGPTLTLKSPIGGGDHTPAVHLLGDVDEAGNLSVSLNGGSPLDLNLAAGEFDQLLQSLPLSPGAHQLALSFTDVAGNATETTLDFNVTNTGFQVGGSGTQGWSARSNETVILGESDSYVVQATQLIDLGQTEGSRTLRFAVNAAFDGSDTSSTSADQLAVYLVDPSNPTQTLLDGGQPGSPVFSLAGEQAEFIAGQVRFDGQFVEIDLTSLADQSQGLLVFQLLNQDGDDGTRVVIEDLSNQVDPDGLSSPVFVNNPTLVAAGGDLNLGSLSLSNDVEVHFSDVRFDAASGQYRATVQLHNDGTSDVGRNVAVVFANLPDGITLQSPSGTDDSGNGYINFRSAIRPGGLTAGSVSDGIEISFSNPDQLRVALQPQVLVGGPNQAPIFETVEPITVLPGGKVKIELAATDPDGDRVTFSLRGDDLPNGKLDGAGNLIFEPRPDQVGTYDLTLVASDGVEEVTQTVSLTVAPDPITTTRISGQILDTDGNPLANLPLELGRLQTVTDAEGYFTFTLPDSSIPTEEINIQIPLGDPAFDPFMTGEQEINLRRTTFDGATGTGASNPLRHPNLVTTFMDGSMVYGSDATRADALRTLDGTGRLKVSTGDLLPLNNTDYFADGPLANNNRSLNDPSDLFAAGDVRANENIGLTSLHTVFVREHNRLADEIRTANPALSGDEVYERARKLVSAQVQHITYQEYLPLLLGDGAISSYSGYDSSVDPAISHLFSAAAFRMGHTQSFDEFLLIDETGQALPSVTLRESTFNPAVIQQYGVDAILRGLFAQSAEAIDLKVLDELRNTLFGPPGSGGIDLAAVDIERGRDVGLPDYNQARIDFGLPPVTSFAEITSDPDIQAALEAVYGDVNNIDVIVGGLAEDKAAGAMVGELFQTIMVDQFVRLRDGDRFWYENGQFTQAELDTIRSSRLSDLIERNTGITGLPDNLFSTLLNPTGPAAGGTVAGSTVNDYAAIDGSNNNLANPEVGTVGTHMRVDYTQEYGDGVRSPGGAERPNTREISNALFEQDESIPDASGATGFMLAWSQFLGHDFTFSPAGAADTLKVYGNNYEGGGEFPFVAEKLNLMLGHEVYAGVNNVIDRPIFLPALDIDGSAQSGDFATEDVTVTNSALGAAVEVKAGTLTNRAGQTFEGTLSITEVPTDLTPAALPEGILPDLVVTIQPGEMVFGEPAELTLPNNAGWPPGFEMELWSINPTTGDFDVVGKGVVSADGQSIETVEGGIRNSSWHFFAPGELGGLGTDDPRNPDHGCNAMEANGPFSSDVNLASGGVIETHELVAYQSLGTSRAVTLTYDSLRADPKPIIHFNAEIPFNAPSGGNSSGIFRLISKLAFKQGEFEYEVPGFEGGQYGLEGGEHFWTLPSMGRTNFATKPAIQADLAELGSGRYEYVLQAGIYAYASGRFSGRSSSITNTVTHVNGRDSLFGHGWGIAGVQELIENEDGSVLIIDGDGSEVLFEQEGGYVSPPGDFSTLEKLGDGKFQRVTKEQTIYSFENNRLVSVKDRNGNETRHIYNGADQLTAITDPVGLTTRFEYANGRVSKIIDPAQRETLLSYDSEGNLEKITDPDTTFRQFQYDDQSHMVGEIDKRGYQERASYDFAGRATMAVRKDGSVVQVNPAQVEGLHRPETTSTNPLAAPDLPEAPETANPETTYRDSRGQVTVEAVDRAGQAVSARDGAGVRYSVQRNNNNLVEQFLTGRGKETTFEYDDRGNVIRVVDELSDSRYSATGLFNSGSSDGNGEITISRSLPVASFQATGDFPHDVASADFNNDGHVDLALVSGDNLVSLFFGDGSGNFTGANNFEFGYSNSVILAEDLDGDGNQDLVVLDGGRDAGSISNGLFVAFGDGEGNFDDFADFAQTTAYSFLEETDVPVHLADLNNDGLIDIVVSSYQPHVILNQGNRSFSNATEANRNSVFNYDLLKLADVNGDGALDIVSQAFTTVREEEDYYSTDGGFGIEILLNQQDGTFGGPISYKVPNAVGSTSQLSFTVADLDQDGFDDILISQTDNNLVEIVWGDAATSLGNTQQYSIDGQPLQTEVADINQDGYLDIVTANAENDTVAVLLGNGTRSWQAPTYYDIGDYGLNPNAQGIDHHPLRPSEHALELQDFNQDGFADIAVVNRNDNSVSVLYNTGTGEFQPQIEYGVGLNPFKLHIADVNSDGYLDVISVNNDAENSALTVLLNNSGSTFEDTSPGESKSPIVTNSYGNDFDKKYKIFDFNQDGLQDIFEVDLYSSSPLAVHINNGDGSFGLPFPILSASQSGYDFTVNDFNNDGIQDIVVSSRGPSRSPDHLRLFLGDAQGGLTFANDISNSLWDIDYIDSADFNGDGNQDLVTVRNGGAEIYIKLANGQGDFIDSVDLGPTPVDGSYISQFNANLISIGDFNQDGISDIGFAYESYNSSAGQATAYVTTILGQAQGNFQRSTTILSDDGFRTFQPSSLKLADVDQDGNLDVVVANTTVEQAGSNVPNTNLLSVLKGLGDGTFSAPTNYVIGAAANLELGVADIDDDGHVDILLNKVDYEATSNSGLSVLLGNAQGEFSPQDPNRYQDLKAGGYSFNVGNFNTDDVPDILTYALDKQSFDRKFYTFLNQVNVDSSGVPDGGSSGGSGSVVQPTDAKLFTYDDTFSQLTSVTDELGRQTLFDIDATNGNIREMRRVIGSVGGEDDVVTTYTYTDRGLIDTETDDLGRVTNYDYDEYGRLIQVTLAEGSEDQTIQKFKYDTAGNLIEFTDGNDNVTIYKYDSMNRLEQMIEADPDKGGPLQSPVTIYDYDDAGNLTKTIDARQNETEFAYDSLNRLIKLTDANDEETIYVYDQAGNVASMTNARGETTTYLYDSRSRLVEETDAEGNKTRYGYDTDNNLTSVTDARGNRTNYVYDARGRLLRTRDANGKFTEYDYDAADNLVALKDRNGHLIRYRYDDLNRRTEIQDAKDNIVKTFYDEVGNVEISVDRRGNETHYKYDNLNRLITVTDALDGEMHYDYDDVGNLTSVIDQLDQETTYVYDDLNRLIETIDPLTHSTAYTYDAMGNLTQVAGELGRVVNYSYDKLNRQTQVTDAYGKTVITGYDEVGNITSVTDQLGRITRYGYDGRNLRTSMSDPLGHTTRYDYDRVGNLDRVTDALGHKTSYQYDKLNRRDKVIDALAQETVTTYDNEGNILSIKDASDNVTTYTYDQLDQRTTASITVDGEILTRTYGYDKAGNLASVTDRNDRTRQFVYDKLNRLETEQWLDAGGASLRTISYGYDAASQLRSLSDPNAAYAFDYDLAGRLTEVDNSGTPNVPNVVLTYGYNAANNLTTVTDTINGIEAGVETFDYDLLNRVTRVSQAGDGIAEKRVDMAYNDASQMTGLTRYSDLAGNQLVAETRYGYDLAGKLAALTHQQGDTVIAGYSFTYDAANRLRQLVTPDGTSDFDYNDRNELTRGDHSYQGDETYGYDNTGNRTNDGYSTGDHNRLLSDGTYTYQYDNEGNRTRREDIATGEVTEYTWDHRNRMTSVVTKDSGGTVTSAVNYAYDAYDRRITKTVDADGAGAGTPTEEHFVYDGDHIALVFDEAGNQTHRYLHGPQVDQVLAQETADGETQWALTDHQGSVRDVIDNDGAVLNHITYDSFGQVTSESDDSVDFRFGYTGRELDDETGLNYYRARYYDSAIGQFVSNDPLGFEGGDANLYRYVFNAPLSYTDPSGQIGQTINRILASEPVYNTLNVLDQAAAGVADAGTFGLSSHARSAMYGETATRNHSGPVFALTQTGTSLAMDIALGGSTRAPRMLRRAYQAADTVRTVYDVANSARNIAQDIANGCSNGSINDWMTVGLGVFGVGAYGPNPRRANVANEVSDLARYAPDRAPRSGLMPDSGDILIDNNIAVQISEGGMNSGGLFFAERLNGR